MLRNNRGLNPFALSGLLLLVLTARPALAQIVPDGSLGVERTQVGGAGTAAVRIEGGATRGSNLFHSFEDFNIKAGQQVLFGNPAGISNIFTRVTGGDRSLILGTLGVDGPANFYLLNPNGILFGPNAQLNLQGAFVASTAEALQFGDRGTFSATNPQAPPLLTVAPSALQFSQQVSSLEVRGLLELQPGRNGALAGPEIIFDGGQLRVERARADVAGLAGAGTIALAGDSPGLVAPDPRAAGRISLREAAAIEAAGAGSSIAVTAAELSLTGGAQIRTIADGVGDTGPIEVRAGTLAATGESFANEVASGIFGLVEAEATGDAGSIFVEAETLTLSAGARIEANSFGAGSLGSINVRVSGAAIFSGSAISDSDAASGIASELSDTDRPNSQGIDITVEVGSLRLEDGARISADTEGQGSAGAVTVIAREGIEIVGSALDPNLDEEGDEFGVITEEPSGIFSEFDEATLIGESGGILIKAESLTLKEGGRVFNSIGGQGNAGLISIEA